MGCGVLRKYFRFLSLVAREDAHQEIHLAALQTNPNQHGPKAFGSQVARNLYSLGVGLGFIFRAKLDGQQQHNGWCRSAPISIDSQDEPITFVDMLVQAPPETIECSDPHEYRPHAVRTTCEFCGSYVHPIDYCHDCRYQRCKVHKAPMRTKAARMCSRECEYKNQLRLRIERRHAKKAR